VGYLSELGSDHILLDMQVRGMSRFSTLFPQLTLSATLGVAAVAGGMAVLVVLLSDRWLASDTVLGVLGIGSSSA